MAERHLARAEAGLVTAAGGSSLCRVGTGPPAGSVKYAEGGYVALRALRHILGSSDPVVLASAVELLETWEAARARDESRGPAWSAYREGGVTALRHLVDDLACTAESARP